MWPACQLDIFNLIIIASKPFLERQGTILNNFKHFDRIYSAGQLFYLKEVLTVRLPLRVQKLLSLVPPFAFTSAFL